MAQTDEPTQQPMTTATADTVASASRRNASVPQRPSRERTAMEAEADQAHRAIVAALEERDIPLARRRVSKHLTALEPLLR